MQRGRKILIMGLPGNGKTTLARALAERLGAVHFNADEVRASYVPPLGFSMPDRVEHAKRMGLLAAGASAAGRDAIADFVCPTSATRAAFGADFTIWCDRVTSSQYADTDALFDPPAECTHMHLIGGSAALWADLAHSALKPKFDPRQPTALFVGRWQPFHAGHLALVRAGFERAQQVCLAVRDTSDDWPFSRVRAGIDSALASYAGRYLVVPLPNVSHVLYGRDVGYEVEQISLPRDVEAIRARDLRKSLRGRAENGR